MVPATALSGTVKVNFTGVFYGPMNPDCYATYGTPGDATVTSLNKAS